MFGCLLCFPFGAQRTNNPLAVPLNNTAQTVLRAAQGDREKAVTYKGRHMRRVCSIAWRGVTNKVDLPGFRFRDMRHTWASWHVMSGTSLQELMELGGRLEYLMAPGYARLAAAHLATAAGRVTF